MRLWLFDFSENIERERVTCGYQKKKNKRMTCGGGVIKNKFLFLSLFS